MKILYLTDTNPALPPVDYLPDQLYHGLVSILGSENVIDYPPKPTYHLETPDGRICRYTFPNLHAGFDPQKTPDAFDIIIVSTPRQKPLINWLLLRELGKPIVAVDGQDDAGLTLGLLYDSVLYFKRELYADPLKHTSRTYASGNQPDFIQKFLFENDPGFFERHDTLKEMEEKLLPISFSVEPELLDIREEKRTGLFFAGGTTHLNRRAALDLLRHAGRRGFDITDGHVGDRAAYLKRLAQARIGLSVRGGGFDCVRFWETPAVGTVLLSERPPIVIHQNFESQKNAIFFDKFDDILPGVESLLQTPQRLEAIARAGREHIRTHHTTRCRAEYFLREIDRVLTQQKNIPVPKAIH